MNVQRSRLIQISKVIDAVAILCAGAIAFYLRYQSFPIPAGYIYTTLLFDLLTIMSLDSFGHYKSRSHTPSSNIVKPVLAGVGLGAILTSMVLFMTQTGQDFSRIWFGLTVIVSLLFVCLLKVFFKALISRIEKQVNFIVIGSNLMAEQITGRFFNDSGQLRMKGHFSIDQVTDDERRLKLKSFIEQQRTIDEEAIEEIWLTQDVYASLDTVKLRHFLADTAARVVFVPELPKWAERNAEELTYIKGIPLLGSSLSDKQRINRVAKLLIDKVVSGLALICLSPVFFVVSILIKVDSRGPVFFKQRRYGAGGKEFEILKFRTMTQEDSQKKYSQAQKGDTRVTRLGRLLRRYSIDELPQLLNVLKGSMSLVGPRPHPNLLNEEFRELIDGYMNRHRVKPGITGLSQIRGLRGETDTHHKMKDRIESDLEYIEQWSLGLDFWILFKTFSAVIKGNNAV